ncbi:MAG TPA: hypothetical protein VGO80_19995 [Solirubrobacteraceae bacterium]|jgi:hypothetical protein|nr:hypothetical protein [Solirubrobacteraceae bacterium]
MSRRSAWARTCCRNFVLGHVVYSFCAPLALAGAMRSGIAQRSWLGWRGIAVAIGSWLLVASLMFADALDSAARATLPEVAETLAVVAALVAFASRVGRGRRPRREHTARVRTALVVSFVAASALADVPETWLGVAVAVAVAVAVVAATCSRARRAVETGAWRTSRPSPPAYS